jgi:adenylyltransferase/sulfurtransferase
MTALLPLVAPVATLSEAERVRYARHLTMPDIGEVGQRRLAAARVLVVGAGGLGSPALMYLAAAGVGTIGIVDDDSVDVSNLQRQVVHGQSVIGHSKTASAAQRIADINPLVTVIEHPQRLTDDNASDIIAGYDVVVDGADNFATRYLINDVCVAQGRAGCAGSVLRFQGQVSAFWAQAGSVLSLRVPTAPADAPSCADAGVFGAVCGVVGSWMAAQTIALITGVGEPLVGRLVRHDASTMQHRLPPHCPWILSAWLALTSRRRPLRRSAAESWKLEKRHRSRCESTISLSVSRVPWIFRLIDIREPHEHDICAIKDAELLPQGQLLQALAEANRESRYIIFCRSGCVQRMPCGQWARLGSRMLLTLAVESWSGFATLIRACRRTDQAHSRSGAVGRLLQLAG